MLLMQKFKVPEQSCSAAQQGYLSQSDLRITAGFGVNPFKAWTPTEKTLVWEEADNRRQATDLKSDQSQTQSDSHQQATETAPRKRDSESLLGGSTVKRFPHLALNHGRDHMYPLSEYAQSVRHSALCWSRDRQVLSLCSEHPV